MLYIKRLSVIYVSLLLALLVFTTPAHAEIKLDDRTVQSNKVWNVTFSTDLLAKSVNTTNVYIEDEQGKRLQNIMVSLNPNDNKVVTIENKDLYTPGTNYILKLTTGIKGKSNQPIRDSVTMSFSVEDNTFKNGDVIETTNKVSVYDNSTGKLVQKGTLDSGRYFKIEGDYGENWVEISFGGSPAYISKKAIKHSTKFIKSPPDNVENFLYSKNEVKIYTSPSKGSLKLGSIDPKNSYPIISEENNYVKISFGGREGYAYKEDVQLGEYYKYINSNVWLKDTYFLENLSKNTREDLPNLSKGKVVDIVKDEFSEWNDSLDFKVEVDGDIYLIDYVSDYWLDEKMMFQDPYEAFKGWGWSEQVWKDIKERKIRLGMDAQAVRLSWGSPDDINSTTTQYGTHEQWVYNGITISSNTYLYFEKGILTTIQD